MSEFWEPWAPKSGDRARIRLSPECSSHWDRHPSDVLESVQGRMVIVQWTDDTREVGHPIYVRFDPPMSGRLARRGALLAVIELEPDQ